MAYGERTNTDGATLVDTPSHFEEAAIGLAAAGAHLVAYVTAEGILARYPIVPALKMSGMKTRSRRSQIMSIQRLQTWTTSLQLFVASGTEMCADGHDLIEFDITRFGPPM